jgi:acetyl esterase/lipase
MDCGSLLPLFPGSPAAAEVSRPSKSLSAGANAEGPRRKNAADRSTASRLAFRKRQQAAAVHGAQEMKRSIPYVENGHARHVLDIYTPANAKNLPVVFWIHGGGWQTGDKANVQEKPAWFTKKGFVFVSINHRLLPEVTMDVLVRDVAKAFGWMHKHIAEHGGDPKRVLVGGHSSGAQLATLICTDDRYLKAEGVSFDSLIGCVPVDGDTYDIPAIIEDGRNAPPGASRAAGEVRASREVRQ